MNTPLVSPDGFPRDDIDVALIRTTRSRINRLQNDIKSLMQRIETGLHEYFRQQAETAGAQGGALGPLEPVQSESPQPLIVSTTAGSRVGPVPFARVDSVAENSPAQVAGLQKDDRIVNFGSVMASSHDQMRLISSLVASSEGRVIPVSVLRDENDAVIHLNLTPANGWGGRGMLGCHVVPL
jgi:26S proteasome non-ATPase regulatory subunit 9